MKQFVLLHLGFVPPTPEIFEEWGKWFESIGDRTVDAGKPFAAGVEIRDDEAIELPLGIDSMTGYTIINAVDMDEAISVAKSCPSIAGIRVYEAGAM
jgi:predicted butyrate kinase (DUF1464 family)